MADEINVQVNADFSTFEKSFKAFSNSLSSYNDIPGMKAQVDELIASFTKLSEVTDKVNNNLLSKSGFTEAQEQLAKFNSMADLSREKIKVLQNSWQEKSKAGLMPISELEKFIDPKLLESKMKEMSSKERSEKESKIKNGLKRPLTLGYDINSQKASYQDSYSTLGIAKELGMTHLPVRVQKQTYDPGVGYSVTGSTSKGPDTHGDYDPSEVFGAKLPTLTRELTMLHEAIDNIKDSFEELKSKSIAPRTTIATKPNPKDRQEVKSGTSDAEFNELLSGLGVDPKTITGKKKRVKTLKDLGSSIPEKFEIEESTLEKEFGTEEAGSNAKAVSGLSKDVQALYKKMNGKGLIRGYNEDVWLEGLSKIKSEFPELGGSALKAKVQEYSDDKMGIKRVVADNTKKYETREDKVTKAVEDNKEKDAERDRQLNYKKEYDAYEAQQNYLKFKESLDLNGATEDTDYVSPKSGKIIDSGRKGYLNAIRVSKRDELLNEDGSYVNPLSKPEIPVFSEKDPIPVVVKTDTIKTEPTPLIVKEKDPEPVVLKTDVAKPEPLVVKEKDPVPEVKLVIPDNTVLSNEILKSKNDSVKKDKTDRIEKSEKATQKIESENDIRDAKLKEKTKTKIKKETQTSIDSENTETKQERKPRSSGNGIINKTPEQLEKELALLTSENAMVLNLINGFKELVNVIKEKNALLVEEGKLVKSEVSDVNRMNKPQSRNENNSEINIPNNESNNTNQENMEFDDFEMEDFASGLNEDNQLLQEGNNQLTDQERKLQSIDNYLSNINIKIGNLRKQYGNLIDSDNIAGPLVALRNSINEERTSPQRTFNRSNPSTEYNSIVNDVKTQAGQVGITSPNAMYAKLVALIKEEANLRVSIGKTEGEENLALTEKQGIVSKQISDLRALLEQYQLLTNVQNESLEIEQQKADLTVRQGEAKQNKSGNSPINGNTQNPNFEESIKSSNQFYTAFESNNGGMLSGLMKLQSSIMNIKFAFQGMLMLMGGKEVYNFLIGTNAQIQTLEASLAVTMKSMQKAEDTVQQLRSYSATTPFQELDTFKSGEMLASNRMDVMSNIKSAGDLASAKATQGTSLEDVVNVMTRINSGDFGKAMIRLRQMGISIADFRTQGLSFSKNNTYEGTSTEMLTALNKIIESRYGGLTQSLGNTVNGSISTIKDYFQQLGIDLGGGIFAQFQASLNKWKKELHDFRNSEEFKQIISNFNTTFNSLKDFILPLGPILKGVFGFASKFMPEIASYIKIFASIKIGQSLLSGVNTLKLNWEKVTAQQAIQSEMINASNEEQIIGNGILDKTRNVISEILAMRKLGLQIATDTSAADAVSASNLSTRGVSFGQKYYTKAGTEAQIKMATHSPLVAPGGIGTEAEIINAGGVSASRTAQYEAEVAAASAETGVGNAASAGGFGAVLSGILSTASLILPVLLLISAGIRGMNSGQDSKFTADDYKRMASEKSTNMENMSNLNIQRMVAKSQIDEYNQTNQNKQEEVTRTGNELKNDPNNTEKQAAFTNAQFNLADSNNRYSVSVQKLQTVTEQLIDIEPKLSSTLIDSTGKITDNSDAFDANTQIIKDNLKAQTAKISADKDAELEAAKREKTKSLKAIETTNHSIEIGNKYSTNAFFRGFNGSGATLWNLINGAIGAVTGNKVTGISNMVDTLKIAQLDSNGRQIASEDASTSNSKEQETISNADKLQFAHDDAIKKGYVQYEKQKDGTVKTIVLVKQYENDKATQLKNSDAYLAEVEGASTRSEEIQTAGNAKVNSLKNHYQVQLNNIIKAHNGSKNSDEYRAMEAERDVAIDASSKQMVDELERLYKQNELVRANLLKNNEDNLLGPISKILESATANGEDLKFSEVQDALNLIASGKGDLITGKMLKYKTSLVSYWNKDLNRDITNLKSVADVTNLISQYDDNKLTIKDSQENLALQISTASKDTKSQEYSDYTRQADNRLSEATSQKEISLQQSESIGDAKGTEAYFQTLKKSDEAIKDIIGTNIEGLRKLLASGKLSEDEQWEAKSKIAELQKKSMDLQAEVNETLNKDKLTLFNEKYDGPISLAKGNRDITLQNDELQNYTTDSTKYISDSKNANLGIRQQLLDAISELAGVIPTLHGLDKTAAQEKGIQLQTEANQIMLDIKKNTNKFGEFNAPGFVKTMTYYDYMTKNSASKAVEIGNASFVFQIDAIQNESDIDNMHSLINESIGTLTRDSDRNGRTSLPASGRG